jgi:hypothetical protein
MHFDRDAAVINGRVGNRLGKELQSRLLVAVGNVKYCNILDDGVEHLNCQSFIENPRREMKTAWLPRIFVLAANTQKIGQTAISVSG